MSDSTAKVIKQNLATIEVKSKKKVGSSGEAAPVADELPVNYPAFNWESLGSDISSAVLAKSLGATKVFKTVTPLTAYTTTPGQKPVAFSFTYPYTKLGYDRPMWAALRSQPWAKEYLQYAIQYVTCNGTRAGMLQRLVTRLKPPRKIEYKKLDFNFLATHLPMRPYDFTQLDKFTPDNPIFDLNVRSDAGFPFVLWVGKNGMMPKLNEMTPVKGVCVHNSSTECDSCRPIKDVAFELASGYLALLKEFASQKGWQSQGLRKFLSYTFQHEDEFTVLLKRKFERMKREEVTLKNRVYCVYPQAVKLLFMFIAHPIKTSMVGFLEDDRSMSALGFSPYYGGAGRVMERIRRFINETHKFFQNNPKSPQKLRILFVAYSDDHLWVVCFKSGKMLILTPDVKSMDLSTQRDMGMNFAMYFANCFPRAPDWWKLGLQVLGSLAFSCRVHIEGSHEALKLNGLMSGVSNTTEINEHDSAHICAIISKLEKIVFEEEEFFPMLIRQINVVKDVLGYEFKGADELERDVSAKMPMMDILHLHHEWIHSTNIKNIFDEGIPLPFLSMKLVKFQERYLYVPYEPYKFGGTLILPKTLGKGVAGEMGRIERMKGAYYSGAWFDAKLAEFILNDVNNRNLKADSVSIDATSSTGQDDLLEMVDEFKKRGLFNSGKDLPPPEFMFDFCTLSKQEVHSKWLEHPISRPASPARLEQPETPHVYSVDDMVPESFDEMQRSFEAYAIDREIDTSKSGNVNANTESKERKLKLERERAKIARAEKKTALDKSKVVMYKKKFGGKHGYEHDVEDVGGSAVAEKIAQEEADSQAAYEEQMEQMARAMGLKDSSDEDDHEDLWEEFNDPEDEYDLGRHNEFVYGMGIEKGRF